MRVQVKSSVRILFAVILVIPSICFAQSPQTKPITIHVVPIEIATPFDKLELLSLFAGGYSDSYAIAQIQQRGISFTPDPTFLGAAQKVTTHLALEALGKQHVRPTGVANRSRASAYVILIRVVGDLSKKDYSSADAGYEEALKLAPDSAKLHLARATELGMNLKYSESEAEARHSLRLWPDDADAHCLLATDLLGEMRDGEAVNEARESVKIFPEHKYGLIALGMALNRNRQYAEAIPVLKDGIARAPEFPLLHKHLGVSLFNTGDVGDAITEYYTFLNSEAEDAEAHYLLGVALRSSHRDAEALAQFREAARLDPKNPVYVNTADPNAQLRTATGESRPDNGTVSGNVYTNSFFGFSLEFPSGWNVLDSGQTQSVMKLGGTLLSGNDPMERDAIRAGAKFAYPLLFVMEGRTNAQTLGMRFLNVSAIKIQGLAENIKSGKDYLELSAKVFKDGAMPFEISGPFEEVSLGGQTLWKGGLVIRTSGNQMNGVDYVTVLNGYALVVQIVAPTFQGLDVFAKSIQSLKFNGAPN